MEKVRSFLFFLIILAVSSCADNIDIVPLSCPSDNNFTFSDHQLTEDQISKFGTEIFNRINGRSFSRADSDDAANVTTLVSAKGKQVFFNY